MQTDKRLISAEPEQEHFSPSAGPVGFPIWIDEEPGVEQPVPFPLYEQEGLEDVDIQGSSNENAAGANATALRRPERRYGIANPATPIPPRASAYPANVSRVRPRFPRSYRDFQEEDVACVPTLPPQTIWQHESPDYQVESSLSSLSLMADEDLPPVQPPPSIDELDTLPPARRRQRDEMLPARPGIRKNLSLHDYYALLPQPPPHISELATNAPPGASGRSLMLRDEHYVAAPDIDDVIEADTLLFNAIVPGEASPTLYAGASRLLVSADVRRRGKRQEYRPSFTLHPWDRVRWWLLYPGRLELLLWLVGTALLVMITCVLLFVTTISLGIVSFGHSAATRSPAASAAQCMGVPVAAGAAYCDSSTASSPAGLKITLMNTTAPLTSTPVQLSGQGFSPQGRVTFAYDNNQPCSPATLQADGRGDFTVTLAAQPALRPGHHRLVVYDQVRKRSVSLDILFTADTASASGS